MRQVRELSADEVVGLERLHRAGASHRERVRAQVVLLSSKGFDLNTLAVIFSSDRDTVRDWLVRFEQDGIEALGDAPKPGRPSKLTPQAKALLQDALQTPTPDFKPQLLQRLKKGALR